MGKRIVIALGGNALGSNLPEQMIAVKQTAKAIVDLIEEGHEVIIAHGNGPQVGMIQKAMAELTRSEPEKYIPCPLSVCVAMSQGYIGYDLQNALREELLDRGIQKGVATVLTQVEVDPNDEAFHNPTKPIGAFMTKEEADKMVAERGYNVIEDAGRGYRRVVASPRPQSIIEIQSIRDMVEAGLVVVACGGGGIPVYTAERETLARLTGFELTRGVLCAMRRPRLPSVEEVCARARRVAVLEGIVDHTNVGAIFRSAAALGIDAVLVTPTCCDPFYRRAVRVSMGTVFQVPWTYLPADTDWQETLHTLGFRTAAMALRDDSLRIDDARLRTLPRLAIVLGTEGDGLSPRTIAACDYTVKIPMAHGVDSLNVAAASAVAFWQLRTK